MPTKITKTFWTIPNMLSLYRICIFPFILYLILSKQESLFGLFITISLATDILDGLISRVFKMQTDIGVKLDSWADTGTYILAFLAIYLMKWQVIQPYVWLLWTYVGFWFVSYMVVFAKFHGLIGLHTWLSKITGYLQGAFIVWLFMVGFSEWLFYVALGVGILALTEEMIIILILTRPQSNVIGLYWVMKNKINK